MDSESVLSRQTLALGECVRPLASKLRTRMQSTPNRSEKRKVIPGLDLRRGHLAHGRAYRSEQVTDILSFAEDHLQRIGANVGRFTDEVNQLGRLVAVVDTPENSVSTLSTT